MNFDERNSASLSIGQMFGQCVQEPKFVDGFATGFLMTRISIIFLYTGIIIVYQRRIFAIETGKTKPVNGDGKELIKLMEQICLEHTVKIIPCVFSSFFMVLTYFGYDTNVAIWKWNFTIMAIEVLGDMFAPLFFHFHFRPKAKLLQERLGLFFMLVLGENIFKLIYDQNNNQSREFTTYVTLV